MENNIILSVRDLDVKFTLRGQTLHAMVIGFVHPTTKTYMEFEAPLPEYFTELLAKLK